MRLEKDEDEKHQLLEKELAPAPDRNFKYLILVLLCTIPFGSYFCFDAPSALQDKFKQDLGITTETFTQFYSWYNWPNVITCFFGGVLIDRVFGVRIGAVLFASLILIGNLVFTVGAFTQSIFLMNLGRFIFG